MIQLSDKFSYPRLLRFTLPSILMMIFTSVYGVVDGFFVSNYVGRTPFAAVNLIMPVLIITGCIGFIFGTGGAALISKTVGEGDRKRANAIFSMNVWVSAGLGVAVATIGFVLMPTLARLLGAEGALLEGCVLYGRINLIALPFFILQYEFQCLFAAAEKPKLGLYVTLASGFTNMILDWLFVAVFRFGLAGAAVATSLSQFIGGAVPLVYFALPNKSLFRLCRPCFDLKAIAKTCSNGSSEFMSSVSSSIVGMLYNFQLMKYAGESGISAYGVLMYVSLVFHSIFIGYSVGSSPIISYNFGAENYTRLREMMKKGLVIISVSAAAMFAAGELLSEPFARLFVSYDAELLEMTTRAFRFYSFSFLPSGFSIFGSAFFTALNDGLTSALISFLRTLVFQVAAVLIFPLIWELDGIWLSIVGAEIMAIIVTSVFFIAKRKKYHLTAEK